MYRRALLPVAFGILAMPVWAQNTDLCPMTDDNENCVRVVACIGDAGRWFHGRAYGRGTGTVAGVMSDGVACSGTWVSRNAVGMGEAEVTCDDAVTVRVLYYYQDSTTGTAKGRGETSTGDLVEIWSGTHVLDYFRDGDPSAEGLLQCGDYGIPMS
jgi:hypothetical protein